MNDTVGEIINHIQDLTGLSIDREKFGPEIDLIVEDLTRNPTRVGDRILDIDGEEISVIRTDGGFLVARDVRFVEVG